MSVKAVKLVGVLNPEGLLCFDTVQREGDPAWVAALQRPDCKAEGTCLHESVNSAVELGWVLVELLLEETTKRGARFRIAGVIRDRNGWRHNRQAD